MYHVKYHIPLPFFFPNQTQPVQPVQPNPVINPVINPFITPRLQPSTLQKKEESEFSQNK